MRKALYILVLLCAICRGSHAQSITQTLRGQVLDKDTRSPLPFVTVGVFADSVFIKGASSDNDGYYRISEIPVGRYIIKANYIGFNPLFKRDIIINSAKECILQLEMEGSVNILKEVVVNGSRKDETLNEMSVVSARMFSTEETNRYAGSRSDAGRMASNFAGVLGSNDSRNDIVVRGNSPFGVLWRVCGVDVPNPNHFAIPGTTGGSVCILNSKTIDNSDFLTGAFPAEYGNALAGVFDLRFRNGNNEKHEFTGQLGFLGTELAAEGPISKEKKSSYLIAYRYSTLKLFESFKIPIGTNAVPNYQDLSFKLNFPNSKGSFSVFGMGGLSKVAILVSTYDKPQKEIYGSNNQDQYFGSSMGMIGCSQSAIITPTASYNLTFSYQRSLATSIDDIVNRDSLYHVTSIYRRLGYRYDTERTAWRGHINKKLSSRLNWKTGFLAERLGYDLHDSVLNTVSNLFYSRVNYGGSTFLFQPYSQIRYKFSDRLVFTGGLHAQVLALNNSYSVEPRAGLRYSFAHQQSLSAGFGLHSQMQPYYVYYQQIKNASGEYFSPNRNIGFSKSDQYVLTYDKSLGEKARIKAEAYYMRLHNIPVSPGSSSYSLLNEGSSFDILFPGVLVNTGSGKNYGLEFTFEKFFSNQYFFMFTASAFNSKYKGSDGIERNTTFNGNYAMNMLAEKDFFLTQSHHTILSFGFKFTESGGQRYTPVDTAASRIKGDIVEIDSLRNSLQFRDYYRLDFKIGLKINVSKMTHELAFDLVNVLNTKNILALTYVYDPLHPELNPVQKEYQLGFLPLFYYKLDF